jgi:predicted outer membrane lipoprotein
MLAGQAGAGRTALQHLSREMPFLAGAVTAALLFTVGASWFDDPSDLARSGLLFCWIFAVMLRCAFGVVRHADYLAHALGEPYGTLILTLAVITIEVSLRGRTPERSRNGDDAALRRRPWPERSRQSPDERTSARR